MRETDKTDDRKAEKAEDYVRAIAEATARREAQRAHALALERQSIACVEFFEGLRLSLSEEVQNANRELSNAGYDERFEGPFAFTKPDLRMTLTFARTPNVREVMLDIRDRSAPMIYVSDSKKTSATALQFLLQDLGSGLNAYTTEGGGTANWSIVLAPKAIAVKIIESVIDGLFR